METIQKLKPDKRIWLIGRMWGDCRQIMVNPDGSAMGFYTSDSASQFVDEHNLADAIVFDVVDPNIEIR
jgi:hypothetical protein